MLMATERQSATLESSLDQAEPDKWAMIAVRPGKEADCADSFRQRGVRCFWPTYHVFEQSLRQRRPYRSRGRRDYRSVIPGYLFTPQPGTVMFAAVMDAHKGILHSVRTHSGDVLALDNEAIVVVRKIEAGLNTPKPRASLHNFKTGQKVRFIDDMHSRWPPGRIARLADDGRIVVETEVMGRLVPFLVFPHQLERM